MQFPKISNPFASTITVEVEDPSKISIEKLGAPVKDKIQTCALLISKYWYLLN